MDAIARLQHWYVSQCNGFWEHQFGVKICTIDNPGWSLEVDLNETDCRELSMAQIRIERSESDWIDCRKEGSRFVGMGGPANLDEIIEQFLVFVSG